jgi:hypothetical protein
MRIINSVKDALGKKILIREEDRKDLIEHLLEMNKGVSFESEFKVMKALVLIDCTGSMSLTL